MFQGISPIGIGKPMLSNKYEIILMLRLDRVRVQIRRNGI